MGRRWLGPLGVRLAVAFVGVALAAIGVFAAVILVAERAGVASLADKQQAQTTDAIVAALEDAYRPNGGWVGANLTPAVTLADSAGVAMVVGGIGRPSRSCGRARSALFSAEGSESDGPGSHGRIDAGGHPSAGLPGRRAFDERSAFAVDVDRRGRVERGAGHPGGACWLPSWWPGAWYAPSADCRRRPGLSEKGRARSGSGIGPGPGELGELGRAFDAMAVSLERGGSASPGSGGGRGPRTSHSDRGAAGGDRSAGGRVTEPSPAALSSVHDEAVRLGRMVEDLQTLASAEAAGLHLERRLLDVGRVAGQAADSLAPRFQAAGIRLEQTVPPTLVVGDPHRLHQVVSNLLANAAKFTPPGGQVSLRVASDGPDALIEVDDTGPGIPEGELGQVWDRFFRGEAGRVVAGSGIGLAVVKELVDAHGGTVAVRNSPDGGACFVVRLPQAATPDRPDPGSSH